jgi:hypothetical protein
MVEFNTEKPSGSNVEKFTRHKKNTEDRRKRQGDELRNNLKKRKAQSRQRSNPNK